MRDVVELCIGFVEDHSTLAEVGPDEVIDVFIQGSGKRRPHPAQQDLIQQRRAALTRKCTNVSLQIRADLEQVVAVRRPDREPAGAGGHQTHITGFGNGNRAGGESRVAGTLRASLRHWGRLCHRDGLGRRSAFGLGLGSAQSPVEFFYLPLQVLDLLLVGR